MFNLFKKKPTGEKITFKIKGMHCTSCSMTIDSELEEVRGVISSETSYAQAKTVITYDPVQVKPAKLKKIIETLEYEAEAV